MYRSPHKKRRGVIASSIERCPSHGGVKIYGAIWPFKFGRQKRAKERLSHRGVRAIAIQPPGYPSGKCLGAGKEDKCRCGKHNLFARERR